jgi:hypothetical protein
VQKNKQKKYSVNLKLAPKTKALPAWLPKWLVALGKKMLYLGRLIVWPVVGPVKKHKLRKKALAMKDLQERLTFKEGETLEVKGIKMTIVNLQKHEILLQTRFRMPKEHPLFRIGERLCLKECPFQVKRLGGRVLTLRGITPSQFEQTGPKIILTDKGA